LADRFDAVDDLYAGDQLWQLAVAVETAPASKEVASNLYERGSQSGDYARKFAAEQPVAALFIAAAIGYGHAYLIHRR
jgi:hypothetical protein